MIDQNELATEYFSRHGHPRMCTPPPRPHSLAEARRIQVHRGQQLPKTAKRVTPPSRWASPFAVAEHGQAGMVDAYRAWLDGAGPSVVHLGAVAYDRARVLVEARFELAGWDLACTCDPSAPCHADVLLEVIAEQDRASRDALAEANALEAIRARRLEDPQRWAQTAPSIAGWCACGAGGWATRNGAVLAYIEHVVDCLDAEANPVPVGA